MMPYRRPSALQKSTMLRVIRFKHECVEACSLGTDDDREFEQHLSECRHILPGVQAVIRRHLEAGRKVVESQKRVGDKPGQMSLA